MLSLLKEEGELDREALYWHYPHYSRLCSVVRYNDWKLIESLGDSPMELYNLKNDPGEAQNLAEANPGKVEELKQMLALWRESVNAQMPEPNPAYINQ